MLTHARTFIEAILQKVIHEEKLSHDPYSTLKERIDLMNEKGYLTVEIRDALHHVRQIGNKAAHDVRMFRYSEALLSWEALYIIVKWYIEVYGPIEMKVLDYQDPMPDKGEAYDMTELEVRLKTLEELLKISLGKERGEPVHAEIAATIASAGHEEGLPGFTSIRKITYKGHEVDIPESRCRPFTAAVR